MERQRRTWNGGSTSFSVAETPKHANKQASETGATMATLASSLSENKAGAQGPTVKFSTGRGALSEPSGHLAGGLAGAECSVNTGRGGSGRRGSGSAI